MANIFSIQQPDLLHITKDNIAYYGANQIWYPTTFQRNAGCGPTTGSHLIWYLSQTHTGCQALCSYDGSKYEGFLHLMEDIWNFITPKSMGVNNTAKMYDQGKTIDVNLNQWLQTNLLGGGFVTIDKK